ncbi:MAG: acyltransferase family protein [bacterium]
MWWSLATEWEFYLVLPIFGWLCSTPVGRRLALSLLGAWLIAYVAWLAGIVRTQSIPGHITLAFSLFGRAPSFIGGGAIAWLSVRRGGAWRALHAPPVSSPLIADAALLAVVGVTVLLLDWVHWFGQMQSQTVPWHGYHVLQALCCTAVLALVVFTPTHLRALLRMPLLLRLGVLSYSMYIVHLPVLTYGFELLGRIGLSGLGTWTWQSTSAAFALWGVCVALSEGTYRGIERPFLRRKSSLRG